MTDAAETGSPRHPEDELRMTLGDHLEELRARIILALVGIAVATLLALLVGRDIVAWLHVPLFDAMERAGIPRGTTGISVTSGFSVYIRVSLIAGVLVASPWVIYQAWRFVAAGLYANERRVALIIAPFSAGMAAIGVTFAYYVLVPICFTFLLTFMTSIQLPADATGPAGDAGALLPPSLPVLDVNPADVPDGSMWIHRESREVRVQLDGQVYSMPLRPPSVITPEIRVDKYINFVAMLLLGVAIAFQLPPVMLIAGWVGILDPQVLARYRRYCILVCAILGAVLTPADLPSMLLLAIPLYLLFEFGLLLVRLAQRRRTP